MWKDIILTWFKNDFVQNHELLDWERTIISKTPKRIKLLLKKSSLLVELILSDTLDSNRWDGKIMYFSKKTIIEEWKQEFNFPMFFITEPVNKIKQKWLWKK